MEKMQCFVVGCKHEVREEIHGHSFCFIHAETVKFILSLNEEFFFPPKKEKGKKQKPNLVLPQDDQDFILSHLDGCYVEELQKQLGRITENSITRNLQKGNFKGVKVQGPINKKWHISCSEIIRIIDSYRNWRSICSVAKKLNEPMYTLLVYARKGLFGPIRKDATGRSCCILAQTANNISKMKRIIKKQRETRKNRQRSHLKKKMQGKLICAQDLAIYLGITNESVLYWMNRGYLEYKKNKRWRLITPQNLTDFIAKIKAGKTKLKNETKIKILGLTNKKIDELFHPKD